MPQFWMLWVAGEAKCETVGFTIRWLYHYFPVKPQDPSNLEPATLYTNHKRNPLLLLLGQLSNLHSKYNAQDGFWYSNKIKNRMGKSTENVVILHWGGIPMTVKKPGNRMKWGKSEDIKLSLLNSTCWKASGLFIHTTPH